MFRLEPMLPSTHSMVTPLDGKSGSMINSDTAREYGVPLVGPLSLDEALTRISDPQLFTVPSDLTDHPWRIITLPLRDSETDQYLGVVAIGLPLSDALEIVERSRLVVALTDVAIILVGAVAATYLVHRAFQPLRQIEAVAERIASGNLSARIPLTEPQETKVSSL